MVYACWEKLGDFLVHHRLVGPTLISYQLTYTTNTCIINKQVAL